MVVSSTTAASICNASLSIATLLQSLISERISAIMLLIGVMMVLFVAIVILIPILVIVVVIIVMLRWRSRQQGCKLLATVFVR